MELASTLLIAAILFCLFDGTLQLILPMKRSARSKFSVGKAFKRILSIKIDSDDGLPIFAVDL
jgi:hypothetical protein